MQPLQWAFVTGVIGMYGAWRSWKTVHATKRWLWPAVALPLLPAVALSISGLPFAIYIKHLYSGPLYTYMLEWEKNQQVYIPLLDFIRLHGPVVSLGLFSGLFFIHYITPRVLPLYIYSIISIGLFFSPIPKMVGILNLRFVSVIPVFVAAYFCAHLLRHVTSTVRLSYRYPVMWLGAFLLLSITIPVTYAHIALGRPNALLSDVNSYLPIGAYQIYDTAKKTILPHEVSLVTPLFAQNFPAFTGRHVFVADAFGTIHFQQKNAEALDFFAHLRSPEERIVWLHKNNIHFIFTYAWTPISDIPELEIIQKNDYAILYKVR